MQTVVEREMLDQVPDWVPQEVHRYLAHTVHGRSIRELAREAGCHASTVLRQVRRYETRRDDFLVDRALSRLCAQRGPQRSERTCCKDQETMTTVLAVKDVEMPNEAAIRAEAPRVLRLGMRPGPTRS